MDQAKEFFRALIPLKVRWVSQASINAAHDEEFLQLIKASGCQGLLIGFETLNEENLRRMRKGFNLMNGGYEKALANLRRHGIRLYVTFILGYDEDRVDTTEETLAFAKRHNFYIVAFNHLTPFPGTPLYQRLKAEGQVAVRPLVAGSGLSVRDGAVRAARHDGRGSRGALRRSPPPVLQPFFHLPAQPGLSGERPRMVHVEPFLFDQPAVSR